MVRCCRTHRLSACGLGEAWAMAGGVAPGASVKSAIGDDGAAPNTTEGAPHAARQRQRTIVREPTKGRGCSALIDGRGLGVGCSIQALCREFF